MGSGSSKKREADTGRVKAKVNAVNAFLSVTKDTSAERGTSETTSTTSVTTTTVVQTNHSHRADDNVKPKDNESSVRLTEGRRRTRADIFAFIDASKKDKLLLEHVDGDSRGDDEEDEDVLFNIPAEVEIVNICAICKKPTMYLLDGFPCRVCSKVFHVECLTASGLYTQAELRMVNRARTKLGWSCETCDNICTLLTKDERDSIKAEFEKLDVNKDKDISQEEFMDFNKKDHEMQFGKPMDDFDLDLLQFQFQMLDADKSGSVDLKEFVKHQATKKLGRKDKTELLKLLTANEIRSAKTMFDLLDANKDGGITENEARNAYKSFYVCLDDLQNLQQKSEEDDTGHRVDVTGHVTVKAEFVMELDENEDRRVDWKEFLRGQALPIISSRPNKYGIPNQ